MVWNIISPIRMNNGTGAKTNTASESYMLRISCFRAKKPPMNKIAPIIFIKKKLNVTGNPERKKIINRPIRKIR